MKVKHPSLRDIILLILPALLLQAPLYLAAQEQDTAVFQKVEKMPAFPGGDQAMYKYISERIHYPDSAKDNAIQGVVYVGFIVRKDGHIDNARILRGIGGGCDEESIRVISGMPKWKPGLHLGIPVDVSFALPIKFALQ